MTAHARTNEVDSPTGQFEFKIRGLLSEQVDRERPRSLKRLLGLVEKNIIVDVLDHVNGNQREAGRILGLKSTTLSAKLRRYGIRVVRRIGIYAAPPSTPLERRRTDSWRSGQTGSSQD